MSAAIMVNRALLKPPLIQSSQFRNSSFAKRCSECSAKFRRSARTNSLIRQRNQFNNPLARQPINHPHTRIQTRTLLSEATTRAPHNPQLRQIILTLNDFLLKPRSLPLPRWISPQQYTFTISEIFGHSSFILVAASYATDDFLQLRIMAVMGAGSMLFFTYFHPHGRVLWLPLKWNMLFIAINSYRIASVMWNSHMANLMKPELKKFREDHLYIVDPVDYYKLMKIGTEEEFEEGDMVIQQGRANPFIRVVLEGELEVRRDGVLTYIVEEGNFLSEAGLHAGLMLGGTIESCASIVVGKRFHPGKGEQQSATKRKVKCIRWNRDELMELLEDDKPLRNALKAVLSWDIVRKLKLQRHMLMEGRVQDPQAWTKKREDQGISRYAAILQNMLRHPEEVQNMSEVLTKYRMIHHIEDADHARALAKAGWTEAEFKAGHKEDWDDEDDYVDDEEVEMARWRRVKRYTSKIIRFMHA
jgi:CRP-like cAMP-binding protein